MTTAIALSTPAGDTTGKPGEATGISLHTNDIHGDFERLKTGGATFTQPPEAAPWGDVFT